MRNGLGGTPRLKAFSIVVFSSLMPFPFLVGESKKLVMRAWTGGFRGGERSEMTEEDEDEIGRGLRMATVVWEAGFSCSF